MNDMSLPTHLEVHILSYADDITIFSQYPDRETAATHLQEYIYILESGTVALYKQIKGLLNQIHPNTNYTLEQTI